MVMLATTRKKNQKIPIAQYFLSSFNLYLQLVGDSEEEVARAEKIIVGILYADDDDRNRIRAEQLRVADELNQ